MNRVKGLIAHAILHAPAFMGDWRWWFDTIEMWAIETCWNLHGEQCWKPYDEARETA